MWIFNQRGLIRTPRFPFRATPMKSCLNIGRWFTHWAYWPELWGEEDEREAAKQAVFDALEGLAEAAASYSEAASLAFDDYTPPVIGAAVLGVQRFSLSGVQSIAEFFGGNPGFADDISNLDRRIRDSVAIDIRQISQVSKYGKVALESVTQNTRLPDYKADTSSEDRLIKQTQAMRDARQAKIDEALMRAMRAIRDVALARYTQFLADWEKGSLSYALGTLGVDAAFLAIEVAIGVAAGIVTGGAGAVALKIVVMSGKRLGKSAQKIIVMLKRAGAAHPKTGLFELDEASVIDHAKKHNGFGDDIAGVPNSKHSNKKDSGGPEGGKTLIKLFRIFRHRQLRRNPLRLIAEISRQMRHQRIKLTVIILLGPDMIFLINRRFGVIQYLMHLIRRGIAQDHPGKNSHFHPRINFFFFAVRQTVLQGKGQSVGQMGQAFVKACRNRVKRRPHAIQRLRIFHLRGKQEIHAPLLGLIM